MKMKMKKEKCDDSLKNDDSSSSIRCKIMCRKK